MVQLPIEEGEEKPGSKKIKLVKGPALRVVKSTGDNIAFFQEIVNSTIHGFGVLFGIAAIPF